MSCDYKVYKSELICKYGGQMITDLYAVHEFFKKSFPEKDSTWSYNLYNIFCATSPSPLWYDLLIELKKYIREFIGHEKPLWMQSWLNFHRPEEVLDWHNHEWPYHGYISIDPKNTETVFDNYKIKNELGNIYIGPGNRMHKVEVIEPFTTPRITLGFDIHEEPDFPYQQFSLMPI